MTLEKKQMALHFSSFQNIWKGGYFEGDPLDPVGRSKYHRIGYISVLNAVYLFCIKPYVKSTDVVLEIGPGRGAWTQAMLHAKRVWCIDAKSREDNGIDDYLGNPSNIVYHQVGDFLCSELPDNTFSYMFSFGCLCHVPWEGVEAYAVNLFPKLKSGANAFWMISDYDKRNRVSIRFSDYDICRRTLPLKIFKGLDWLNRKFNMRLLGPGPDPLLDINEKQDRHDTGRWYNIGRDRTVSMLENIGYRIVSPDLELVPRDVIIHFMKP